MKLETLIKGDNLEVQNYIISEIRDYINKKNFEPGDKLPSERMLSEKLEVSRNNVREAIQKLEFYGLLKSKPQSGTFMADIGIVAFNGMVDDILSLKKPDFKSLVETRILLELKTVRLAALRSSPEDLKRIKNAMKAYEDKVSGGEDAVEEDLMFHLAIARAARNSTIETFMLKITPEIITNFEKYHVCDENQKVIAIDDHKAIYKAIKLKDPKLAKQKMKDHFKALYQYCYNVE